MISDFLISNGKYLIFKKIYLSLTKYIFTQHKTFIFNEKYFYSIFYFCVYKIKILYFLSCTDM